MSKGAPDVKEVNCTVDKNVSATEKTTLFIRAALIQQRTTLLGIGASIVTQGSESATDKP